MADTAVVTQQMPEESSEENLEQHSPTASHKLRDWSPVSIIEELYRLGNTDETNHNKKEISNGKAIDFEGYIERLPYGQDRKSTLRTWKMQYLRVRNGILYCYESNVSTNPIQVIELRGGFASAVTETQFTLDNQRGEVLSFRVSCASEAAKWIEVFTSHFNISAAAHAVVQQPSVRALDSVRSLARTGCPTIIIDLGSSSVRAGLLGPSRSPPSLPTYFAPASVAVSVSTGADTSSQARVMAVGAAAYDTPARHRYVTKSLLSTTVLSGGVLQNRDLFVALFEQVFRELSIEQAQLGESTVLLCLPQYCMTATATRHQLIDLLISHFGVGGVALASQSYCALLAYKALERGGQTGMSVSLGATVEITTVIEGSVFTAASLYRSMALGGNRMLDQFRRILTQHNHRFLSEVEIWVVRYILEKTCLVRTESTAPKVTSQGQHESDDESDRHSQSLENSNGSRTLNLSNLTVSDWSNGTQTVGRLKPLRSRNDSSSDADGAVSVELSHLRMPTVSPSRARVRLTYDARTQVCEGLFDSLKWDADCTSLPRVIYQQVQSCPIDTRRTILRNIYLSGGLSRIPGLAERLSLEIRRLMPPQRNAAVEVEVHALPAISYHAPFLGAQAMVRANSEEFFSTYRITKDQWTACKSSVAQFQLVSRFV